MNDLLYYLAELSADKHGKVLVDIAQSIDAPLPTMLEAEEVYRILDCIRMSRIDNDYTWITSLVRRNVLYVDIGDEVRFALAPYDENMFFPVFILHLCYAVLELLNEKKIVKHFEKVDNEFNREVYEQIANVELDEVILLEQGNDIAVQFDLPRMNEIEINMFAELVNIVKQVEEDKENGELQVGTVEKVQKLASMCLPAFVNDNGVLRIGAEAVCKHRFITLLRPIVLEVIVYRLNRHIKALR